MKRSACIALAPIGLALFAYACGGSDGSSFTGGDDGGLDSTTGFDGVAPPPGGDAGADGATAADGDPAGGDGSIGKDGAAGGDSGLDAATPDGGVPPSPQTVVCGTTSCTLPAACCVADGGATCVNGGGGCNGGVVRECDEAADCPQTPEKQVCCYEITAGGLAASCHGDCGGGGGNRVQACRTLGECLSGSCTVRACIDGGSVETCTPVPNLCP